MKPNSALPLSLLLALGVGCAPVSSEDACDKAIELGCLEAPQRDLCILGEEDNRREANDKGCLGEYEDWVGCVYHHIDTECSVTECAEETSVVNACLAG